MAMNMTNIVAGRDVKTTFLRGIQCVVSTLLASSAATAHDSIHVIVKEKTPGTDGGTYHCKTYCSGGDQLQNLDEFLSINEGENILESMLYLQGTLGESSCLQLEKSSINNNFTVLQRLQFDSDGRKRIIENRKEAIRTDGTTTVVQLRCVAQQDEMLQLCLELHEFMYKIRAFCSVDNMSFVASVGDMKYSTNFVSSEREIAEVKGIKLLAQTSHFFKDIESQRLTFSSSKWQNISIPSDSPLIPQRKLRFLVVASAFNHVHDDSQETCINLYFSTMYGPLLRDSKRDLNVCSLLPFSELNLSMSNVDSDPSSNGLVGADFVLKASSPKSYPQNWVVVVLLLLDVESMQNSNPQEKLAWFNYMRKKFPSLASTNNDVIKHSFFVAMKKSLQQHLSKNASLRKSTELQQAVVLTSSSVKEIVSASSSTLFRETCFGLLGVTNSEDLELCLREKLSEIAETTQESRNNKRKRQSDAEAGMTQDELPVNGQSE